MFVKTIEGKAAFDLYRKELPSGAHRVARIAYFLNQIKSGHLEEISESEYKALTEPKKPAAKKPAAKKVDKGE